VRAVAKVVSLDANTPHAGTVDQSAATVAGDVEYVTCGIAAPYVMALGEEAVTVVGMSRYSYPSGKLEFCQSAFHTTTSTNPAGWREVVH
jgi:hypothetical protein